MAFWSKVRLLIAIFAYLLMGSIASGQSTSNSVRLNVAQIESNILITADIQFSLLSEDPDKRRAQRTRLMTTLKAAGLFGFSEDAGCVMNAFDALPIAGTDGAELGISAGWEFKCANPTAVASIDVGLFDLLAIESIDVFVFPDKQQVLLKEQPILSLP
jgi:hypothetical protein